MDSVNGNEYEPSLTSEQRAALDRYWAARTPAEESAAYKEMMMLGLPDGYQDPHAKKLKAAEAALIELEMLREFFDCWEELHRIARKVAVPRRLKENAAQRLVDAADTIRTFRDPVPERPKLEVVKS